MAVAPAATSDQVVFNGIFVIPVYWYIRFKSIPVFYGVPAFLQYSGNFTRIWAFL